MDTHKHTPGPWTYSDMSGVSLSDTPYAAAHIGAGDSLLAILDDDYHNRETCMANAAVMAAAPELLSSLKELLEFHKPSRYQSMKDYEICEKAENAIRKATTIIKE